MGRREFQGNLAETGTANREMEGRRGHYQRETNDIRPRCQVSDDAFQRRDCRVREGSAVIPGGSALRVKGSIEEAASG